MQVLVILVQPNNVTIEDNSESSYVGHAMVCVPALGSISKAEACDDGFSMTIGGGGYAHGTGGSGGFGVQWLNPAGVAIPDGTLVDEFVDLSKSRRAAIYRNLDSDDANKLACLADRVVRDRLVAENQIKVIDRIYTHRKQLAQITGAFNVLNELGRHACPILTTHPEDHVVVTMSMPKESTHDRQCHDIIDQAAGIAFQEIKMP